MNTALIERLGALSFFELRDGRLHTELGQDVTDELLGALEQQPAGEPIRKVYICQSCDFPYADQPPSSCDCMGSEEYKEAYIYTSPQPAAPAIPEGWRLVNAGALQMVVNALRRDAAEGKVIRGEMADELLSAAPEQKGGAA